MIRARFDPDPAQTTEPWYLIDDSGWPSLSLICVAIVSGVLCLAASAWGLVLLLQRWATVAMQQ